MRETPLLDGANTLLLKHQPKTTDKIHPRLVYVAIEEGSWVEEEVIQDMWAGLLASATSPEGESDENLIFMNLLKQLSSLQFKILNYAIDKAQKYDAGHGLPFAHEFLISITELPSIFGVGDLERFDRELGLIGQD